MIALPKKSRTSLQMPKHRRTRYLLNISGSCSNSVSQMRTLAYELTKLLVC